jgi:hypothetical protein
MSQKPRQPKAAPTSKAGLKEGKGAAPSQSNPKVAGPKRPVEEEDVFGGAERTHDARVSSKTAKP